MKLVGDMSRVEGSFCSALDANSGQKKLPGHNENLQIRFVHFTQRIKSKNQGSFLISLSWYNFCCNASTLDSHE